MSLVGVGALHRWGLYSNFFMDIGHKLPPKRMTDTCENITFPATLLVCGKTNDYTPLKTEELF